MIRRLAEDLRDAFKALIRAVKEIVSVIASVFKWLANMVNICNHNMGKPYKKCKKVQLLKIEFEKEYRLVVQTNLDGG